MDLGNVADKIRQPKTPDWQIQLSSFNVSKACQKLRFKDTISQPGEFNLELMVKPGDIVEDDELLVSKAGSTVFSGVVKRPENSSNREDRYQGLGPGALIKGTPITNQYNNSNTDDIVSDVFNLLDTTKIVVGVNERLNSQNNVVDARAEDEDALKFLNRVIMSHGGDWNVTYNPSSEIFEFNVYQRLESSEVVKEFRGGGDDSNIRELNDKRVFDKEYDAVIVKGYGDGEDQVQAHFPKKSEWPDDPEVLKHTDKTIFSEREAETKAENIYNDHQEWRNIELVPANNNEVLNLGDLVEVNEENTGISAEFRVVQRKLNLDFRGDNEIKYVLSDRPVDLVEEVTDIQEQTKSETDYMQGSRNVWSDKESGNAAGVAPLEHTFYIPKDIEDLDEKERLERLQLDYSSAEYRTDQDPVTVSAESLELDEEDNEDLFVELGIQPDVVTTSAGGGGVVEKSEFSSTGASYPMEQWNDLHTAKIDEDGYGDSDQVGASMFNNISLQILPDTSPSGEDYIAITTFLRFEKDGEYFPDSNGLGFSTIHPANNAEDSFLDNYVNASINYFQPIEENDEITLQAYWTSPAKDSTDFLAVGTYWYRYVEGLHSHTGEQPSHENADESPEDRFAGDNTQVVDVERLSELSEEVSLGDQADEVYIYIDGVDRTEEIYGQSPSGKSEDEGIEILPYLDEPLVGRHTIEIEPVVEGETVETSYLRSRVVLDHHKDAD